jgi:hypothetical protein
MKLPAWESIGYLHFIRKHRKQVALTMKPEIETEEAMPFLRSASNSGPPREKLRLLTRMMRLGELFPAATHALVFLLT